jgi:filamentous hemagglutinin
VAGRAAGSAGSIRVATGTTSSTGTQIGATLATSGGIVAMSVAPVMSRNNGVRLTCQSTVFGSRGR